MLFPKKGYKSVCDKSEKNAACAASKSIGSLHMNQFFPLVWFAQYQFVSDIGNRKGDFWTPSRIYNIEKLLQLVKFVRKSL